MTQNFHDYDVNLKNTFKTCQLRYELKNRKNFSVRPSVCEHLFEDLLNLTTSQNISCQLNNKHFQTIASTFNPFKPP